MIELTPIILQPYNSFRSRNVSLPLFNQLELAMTAGTGSRRNIYPTTFFQQEKMKSLTCELSPEPRN